MIGRGATLLKLLGRTQQKQRLLFSSTAAVNAKLSSGGYTLKSMAAENPYMDVVRYEHKNQKFNLGKVDFWSDALAVGLVENNLQPGDVVLSWLPAHFSEQMILQFACSKAGMLLYTLDPALAIQDQEAAKTALKEALTITKANVFVSQEAGDDVDYYSLCEAVIPEIRVFDFANGMPFVTPRFPHLRFPIHTGFDQQGKWGMLTYKSMLVGSDDLEEQMAPFEVTEDTPLLGQLVLDENGIPTGVGKPLTNKEVLANKVWPTYASILSKDYHEVAGIGVCF